MALINIFYKKTPSILAKTGYLAFLTLFFILNISNSYAQILSKEDVAQIPIQPQDSNLRTSFWDWTLFKTSRKGRQVCYIASTPIIRTQDHLLRGEPYFLVTNIPNDADEITTSSGFIYKATSDVEISFGSKKFYLFPYMAVAWADNSNDDIDIIKEMQKSDEMTISGLTRDNITFQDTYSLIGFSKAYFRLKEECK